MVENDDTEDGEKIGTLQAFHGVGTRGLFYFFAEHRDGLGVRLSGCHCPFCVRCYRKNGIGSMPTGCLSNEPYQYIVCNRLDDEWTKQTSYLITRLSEGLRGQVKQGDIIAVASKCHLKGSNNCIYDSFDIVKVLLIQDSTFTVNVFTRQPNTPTYHNSAPDKSIAVSHASIRYLVSDACLTVDFRVTLDSITLENIVKSCFNGV